MTTPRMAEFRAVFDTLDQPRSVEWLAAELGYSPDDVQWCLDHIDHLAVHEQADQTYYAPSPRHARRQARAALADRSVSELQAFQTAIREGAIPALATAPQRTYALGLTQLAIARQQAGVDVTERQLARTVQVEVVKHGPE